MQVIFVKLRYSDMVKFCKKALGKEFKPAAGYTWNDVFLALTKRKKWPKHPKQRLLKQLGLNLPYELAGRNISPFNTKIIFNQ